MIVRVEVAGDVAVVFAEDGSRIAEVSGSAVRRRLLPKEQHPHVVAWFDAVMEDGILELGEKRRVEAHVSIGGTGR